MCRFSVALVIMSLAMLPVPTYAQTACVKGVQMSCPSCTEVTNNAACLCTDHQGQNCWCAEQSGPYLRVTCFTDYFGREDDPNEAWVPSDEPILCSKSEICSAQDESEAMVRCGHWGSFTCVYDVNPSHPCHWMEIDRTNEYYMVYSSQCSE